MSLPPHKLSLTNNQRALIANALKTPDMPRNTLAKRVGISPPSAMRAIRPLLDSGVLTESPAAASGRGKPPSLVSVSPGALSVLGVSITSQSLRVTLSDLVGSEIATLDETCDWTSAAAQLAALDRLVDRVLEAHTGARPVAVGVVVQGYFLERGRRFAARQDKSGWAAIDLRSHLETRLGLPVQILNDGKALAAHIAQNRPNVHALCIALGTGIGGGLISYGQVIEGRYGNAGEIGQLFAETATRPVEPRFLEAAGCSNWHDWKGLEALKPSQRETLHAWLDIAAEKISEVATTVLAILDYEDLFISARFPDDILTGLVERVEVAPLGSDFGEEAGLTNPPPRVTAFPKPRMAHLACRVAEANFLEGTERYAIPAVS